jgi:NADPH2:quinone reductase
MKKNDGRNTKSPRATKQSKGVLMAAAVERYRKKKGMMKAVAMDRFGPPEVLTPRSLPIPEPGPNEVLIELHASGVGVWDAEIREGWWPEGKPEFPLVLGTDGAGIVVAKGARVRRFEIGDRIWAYEFINPKGGFYAEYVAVDARHAGNVPKGLDLLRAGASTVTGLTALQGIENQLHLRKGETVLIFGATGAVGTLAVQFAKNRKARVLATASGRRASALVRRLGAEGVVDARSPNLPERLLGLAPEGLDTVLALAGGKALEQCIDLVREGGRVAYPNGVEPVPGRREQIRFIAYNGEASPRHFERFERAVEEAALQPAIEATYPLAQTAKAHERLKRGHVLGRIVLRVLR